MEIGIGLPNAIAGTPGEALIEFARRADQAGFSSLGTIDRIVYDNHEPLVALAAAAAVTERIRLATTILITPLRPNTALLAKQAATLDSLAKGRLWLGIAPGGREDDYAASGVSFAERGRILDRQVEELKSIWAGEPTAGVGAIGPTPVSPGGPELIFGGHVDATFERAARHGAGWMMGGAPPEQFGENVAKLEAAWQRAGREGTPRKLALGYYALGDRAEDDVQRGLRPYYAFLGEELANMLAASVPTTPEMVKARIDAFEQHGCDELVLFPASSDPGYIDLLAEVAGKA